MDYIYVKNNEVVGYPRPLPTNWEDVSNFFAIDPDIARTYGWYPVRVVPAANKTSNDVVTGQKFVIEGNEVVQYEQIRTKSPEEVQQELNEKWESVRIERNKLLADSDWTQLADVPFLPEKKQEWAEYRQSLRDITQQSNPYGIEWPSIPQ